MRIRRTSLALVTALVASTGTVTAQQSSASPDSARAQIRTRLRAFYFNLAHGDWGALTVDILGAKVDANRRAPPEAIVAAETSAGDAPVACSPATPALADQAVITLQGDWAQVSVPRCAASSAADQFRMIHLEERWRFVNIHLLEEPVNLSTPPPAIARCATGCRR